MKVELTESEIITIINSLKETEISEIKDNIQTKEELEKFIKSEDFVLYKKLCDIVNLSILMPEFSEIDGKRIF